MVLQLSPATAVDVDRIAAIHLAAFDSNVLLHAQFPTPSSLAALRSILSNDMLHTIQEGETSRKVVLVVRDSAAGDQIIGFAKWDLPGLAKGTPVHPDVTWPAECRKEFLDEYHTKAEAAKERVMGDGECYRLTFVGTDPKFQGQGAGTMLTEWGLARAQEDSLPVYLESTIAASSLYRHLGFVSLDGFSMTLPGYGPDGGPNIYEEVGMLKVWDGDDGMDRWDSSLNISSLKDDYAAGIKPQHVVQAIYDRIEAYKEVQPSVWIYLHPIGEVMRAANELEVLWTDEGERPPLWGVPFSVKDSINIAGIPTTIGCPALAFTPTTSATVFQKCIEAGGLFIGKTNMEQLATGMTGCRSPYGTLHSTFSKAHIVGGSSSGSAVSISEGLVSFSLGSDTAGSIRVPALFNGVVGFKPTKGTVSASGVSPACFHQDCVSFLATNVKDAETIWQICKGYDKTDLFAKRPSSPRKPVEVGQKQPKQLQSTKTLKPQPTPLSTLEESFEILVGSPPDSALAECSADYRKQFAKVIKSLESIYFVRRVDLDWAPFTTANDLLYKGSFVQERLTIFPDGWFENSKHLLHPVTRQVFENAVARQSTAIDLFRDFHKQAECKRIAEEMFKYEDDLSDGKRKITLMVVPTAPFHPTIEEIEKDPIDMNTRLGAFAHFANVLDLTAIAVPCGTYEVGDVNGIEGKKAMLPFGVTILAGYELDAVLLEVVNGLEDVLRDAADLDDSDSG